MAVACPLVNCVAAPESVPITGLLKMVPAGTGNGGRPYRLAAAVDPPVLRPNRSAVGVVEVLAGIDAGLALCCRSSAKPVVVGNTDPARTPAAGPVLTPHQLSFAMLDPPPVTW